MLRYTIYQVLLAAMALCARVEAPTLSYNFRSRLCGVHLHVIQHAFAATACAEALLSQKKKRKRERERGKKGVVYNGDAALKINGAVVGG